MKVSLNWLKEFVDFKISAKELADKIAMSVVEVEEIIDFEKLYKDIVVGEIREIKNHPHADKLSVAKVSLWKKSIQIIFGASQLKVGDKLPIAVAPAILPTGLEVKKVHIRGIESQGMIVSNKEMGLGYVDEDIMFFKGSIQAGTPVVQVLGIHDIVLNLDVLSNRPDLFSHLGVAREISAILNKKVKPLKINIQENTNEKIKDYLEIEVIDKKLCPRYEARVIENAKIGESPQWLKGRLIVLGIRPINNVVDVTNYVMMEVGQPLHAFDYEKLSGNKKKKIIVKRSRPKGKIITLDDKIRRLTKEVLIIADTKGPIAAAGVMGGKATEVDESTKTIILESANFNWVSIRKATRILGVRTEAVNRFEKGLDPNLTDIALDRATQLISEITKGEIISGKIDVNYTKELPKNIELRLERLNKFLGQKYSSQRVKNTLSALGMDVIMKNDKVLVKVPTFRRDIKEEIDLIEEVARISGYDKIPATYQTGEITPTPKNDTVETEKTIKCTLKGLGATEVYNYSFVGEELLEKFGGTAEGYYKLKNPLKPEHACLRKNLIFSMIETAELNAKNFEEFSIFEIAKVFSKSTKKIPDEKRRVAILSYFKKDPFFNLKGILEGLFSDLGIRNVGFEPDRNHSEFWHPQRVASIIINGSNIGRIGEIHPEVWEKFDFKNKVAVLEIDFNEIMKQRRTKTFSPFSHFPKVSLDIAIIMDDKIEESSVRETIMKSGKELVSSVEFFDVYHGSQVEVGKKSLAYHITYQSAKKTLTDEEVNAVHQNIIKSLSKKFNAKIRSKDGSKVH